MHCQDLIYFSGILTGCFSTLFLWPTHLSPGQRQKDIQAYLDAEVNPRFETRGVRFEAVKRYHAEVQREVRAHFRPLPSA